jgi:hypothetical protein
MVVDSILDGLRREHQRQHRKIRGSHSSARSRKTNNAPGEGGSEEYRPSSASSFNTDSPLASYQSNSSLHRLASNHLFNLGSPNKEAGMNEKAMDGARVTSPEPMNDGVSSFAQSLSGEGVAPRRGSIVSNKSARTPDINET